MPVLIIEQKKSNNEEKKTAKSGKCWQIPANSGKKRQKTANNSSQSSTDVNVFTSISLSFIASLIKITSTFVVFISLWQKTANNSNQGIFLFCAVAKDGNPHRHSELDSASAVSEPLWSCDSESRSDKCKTG